jgi:hypothetical protein
LIFNEASDHAIAEGGVRDVEWAVQWGSGQASGDAIVGGLLWECPARQDRALIGGQIRREGRHVGLVEQVRLLKTGSTTTRSVPYGSAPSPLQHSTQPMQRWEQEEQSRI